MHHCQLSAPPPVTLIWLSAAVWGMVPWSPVAALLCTANDAGLTVCDGAARECSSGRREHCRLDCPPGQTRCRHGRACVHVDWLCDGVLDCSDGSDEADCTPQQRRCGPSEVQCRSDGQCLEAIYRCDGRPDCDDGSDEVGCSGAVPVCAGDGFWCARAGFCLEAHRVCDGVDDCGDAADELLCRPPACLPGQLQCDTLCIQANWVCDGNEDCVDGRDERDCPTPGPDRAARCPTAHFMCSDGFCVPEEDRCDGHEDCEDGGDEVDCGALCAAQQFHCPGDGCISRYQLCDGVPDCPDGHDEEQCAPLVECPSGSRCEHLCLAAPAGALPNCTCRPGYRLLPDGKSCRDVNECDQRRPCSQLCANTAGGFTCSCRPGYQLRPDGVSCRAQLPPAQLLLALQHAVQQVKMTGSPVSTLYAGLANAAYVDFHWTLGLLLWLDTAESTIYSAPLDGSAPPAILFAGLQQPAGLAVDWLHLLLYWAEERPGHISVSGLDGTHRTSVVSGRLSRPRAICVHPQRALLFWADVGASARIERSDGDGGQRRTIVSERLIWPNGLTLDLAADLLYWADAKLNNIGACTLDGARRWQVLERAVPHPFGLTLFEDSVFWTDWKTQALHTAGKRHGEGAHQVLLHLEQPMDVRVLHPQRQPGTTDRCLGRAGGGGGGAACSQLCLPQPDGHRCGCSVGLHLRNGSTTQCTLLPSEALLLVQNHSLQLLPLDGTGGYSVLAADVGGVSMVAASQELLFWADDLGRMHSAFWNGTAHHILLHADIVNVTALAVWDRLLYWTDSELGRLEVATADGQWRALLLQPRAPSALALHPAEGLLFWASRAAAGSAQLERAGMDGSGRRVVVGRGLAHVSALVVCRTTSSLYWSDSQLGTISVGQLTATGVGASRRLYSTLAQPQLGALTTDLLVWVAEGSVYNASRNGRQQPRRVDVGSDSVSNDEPPVPVLALSLLAAAPPVKAKSGQCGDDNGRCSHLCLPSPRAVPTCRCPTGVPLSGDGRSCDPAPRHSLLVSSASEVRRITLPAPPAAGGVVPPSQAPAADPVLPLPTPLQLTAMGWEPRTEFVFYADVSRGRLAIVAASIDGVDARPIVTHQLGRVVDIAVDPVSSKVFWADAARLSVEVCELSGATRQLLVVTPGERPPRALAVSHQHGLVAWTDAHASQPQIHMAWMDGTNQSVLVSTGLGRPMALLFDGHQSRLLWTDHQLGVIESVALDGTGRSALVAGLSQPFGLALRGALLFWTQWRGDGDDASAQGGVFSRNLSSGAAPTRLTRPLPHLTKLILFERDSALVRFGCGGNNGDCAGLCLRVPRGQTCRCGTGLPLLADARSCPAQPHRSLLMLTVNSVARVSLDTARPWEVTLPVTGVRSAAYIAASPADDSIIFSDRGRNQIRAANVRAPLVAGPGRLLFSAPDIWPEGVAVDAVAGLVFFSDARTPAIAVVGLSGCCLHRLVTERLERPRAVALLAARGRLFWVDEGGPARIEASRLDGSQRATVVGDELGYPTGLAVTKHRVFWADARLHRVESADLTGQHRRVLVSAAPHPFGLAVLGDWVYWTDWEKHSLERASANNGSQRTVLRPGLEWAMGLTASNADYSRPGASLHACVHDNGGCTHLCLHLGEGRRVCACPDAPDPQRPCSTSDSMSMSGSGSASTDDGGGQLVAALLVAAGLLVLLLVVGLLLLLLRRRSRALRRAPDQPATLTFSNPTYNSSASDFSGDRRFSWRRSKYDKTQETSVSSVVGSADVSGTASLEAAALIDVIGTDANSCSQAPPQKL